MTELNELYQELIIDHGRNPRHFGVLLNANHTKEGFNPLCGDKLTVYLEERNGIVQQASFTGAGCAISIASASLMMESLIGKTLDEVNTLFEEFHEIITQGKTSADMKSLGKLNALAGVAQFPMRVKCATLAWHTVKAALQGNNETITTE